MLMLFPNEFASIFLPVSVSPININALIDRACSLIGELFCNVAVNLFPIRVWILPLAPPLSRQHSGTFLFSDRKKLRYYLTFDKVYLI